MVGIDSRTRSDRVSVFVNVNLRFANAETFRLHPPVPILTRVCTKKYRIPDSDVTVNVGEKVIIPVYSLHHDPKYYPHPEKFDPERFNQDNKNSRPLGTFLPFGDGPRICIGKYTYRICYDIRAYGNTFCTRSMFVGMRFAMMEVKTGLAEILSKFEVKPCPDTQIPIKIKTRSLLLTPDAPIRLTFKQLRM